MIKSQKENNNSNNGKLNSLECALDEIKNLKAENSNMLGSFEMNEKILSNIKSCYNLKINDSGILDWLETKEMKIY